MRAFVALPCPPILRASIARKIGEWKATHAGVAWIDPAAAHVTLRFLGNAKPDDLERLVALLSEAASSGDPVVALPEVGRAGDDALHALVGQGA